MGAEFRTITVSASETDEAVRRKFERAQEQDRYENGHVYSGGFGMADGLRLRTDLPDFENHNAAREWLIENCEKWQNAIGVRHKTNGETMWLIGAWCAS